MIKSMCYIIESDQSVQILQTFVFENVWVHIWGHDISIRKASQWNFNLMNIYYTKLVKYVDQTELKPDAEHFMYGNVLCQICNRLFHIDDPVTLTST